MDQVRKSIIFIAFLVLIYFYSILPEEIDKTFQSKIFIIVLISSIVFYFSQRKIINQFGYVNLTNLFVIGYFIVFFQIPFLNYFGFDLNKSMFYFIWVEERVVNKSILISAIGILSFYLGFIFFKKFPLKQSVNVIKKESINFLITSAYICYILFFLSSGSYKSGVYWASDSLFIVTYLSKLFNVFLSAAIINRLSYITSMNLKEISIRIYLSFFEKSLLYLILWHLVFSLFVGDRGPILYYTLMVFSIFLLRIKKIGIIKIGIIIFVSSIFLSAIGIVRQSRDINSSYIERVENFFVSDQITNTRGFETEVPGIASVELAMSIKTLNYSIANVPKKYDYGYGIFQAKYLASVIPGFWGGVMNLFNIEEKYNGSSSFITYLIQGNDPQYGNGSSVVADFYLDFGLPGVILGLFLFGVFVGKNEYKLYYGTQKISFLWIALIVYFSLAVYINRSAIMHQFASIVLIYFSLKINQFNNQKNR